MSKPVYQKLGITEGSWVLVINSPSDYRKLTGCDVDIEISSVLKNDLTFIHLFAKDIDELEHWFPKLKDCLKKTGMLWISWPKRSSTLSVDLNENIIRDTGIVLGLVDVKVCSIDLNWSALKFVYRSKDR